MNNEIKCQRCGACCRIEGIVRLGDADVAAMSAELGVAEEDFIRDWTQISPDRKSLVLKDAPDGACIMLTKDNCCRVYDVRPEKCRTFPLQWTNAQSLTYCPYCRSLARWQTTHSS